MNIYELQVKNNHGEMIPMENYRGKVLLIVNTATGCGFTPQYKGLEALYEKYQDQGFEILDFPSNQFANQAPGTDEQIEEFCVLNFGTRFPRFAKVDVNGPDEEPLFTLLKKAKRSLLGGKIKWNFTKFLVDRNGNVVNRFSPTEKPENLEATIESLLQN